jgi:hypothetical protein
MALARHANTRDANEQPIVDALIAIGATVFRMDRPSDLLVGYEGRNYLLEVKLPLGPRGGETSGHNRLSDTQVEFEKTWRGQYSIVRSPEDAIDVVMSVPASRAAIQ